LSSASDASRRSTTTAPRSRSWRAVVEDVEPFSRLYKSFDSSWPPAVEALGLAEVTTRRRIDARFRNRKLGKVWHHTEETLFRAAGRVPSVGVGGGRTE